MTTLGFTGTQLGMTRHQLKMVGLIVSEKENNGRGLVPVYSHARHGMCIGADKQFHDICRGYGLYIIGHPGVDKYGKSDKRAKCDVDELMPEKEYLFRNDDIVRSSDILLATPKEDHEELRSGTWSTIRRARRVHLPHIIVWPDGSVDRMD